MTRVLQAVSRLSSLVSGQRSAPGLPLRAARRLRRQAADVLRAFICAACAMSFAQAASREPRAVVYPTVDAGYRLIFPRDEGAHPEFRTEWWYVTGWLERQSGKPIGFQITFFRTRPGIDEDNPSRFAPRQLLLAHAAISDPDQGSLLRAERAARAGFGLAEAKEGVLDVHIDDWSLRASSGEGYVATVAAREFAMEIALNPTQAPLLHGMNGYSQKGPDPKLASYYYSLPQLEVSGEVAIEGRQERVNGVAWLDHEWMSKIMDDAAQGWDWTGLNLHDGGALAILQMRHTAGGELWAYATERGAGGAAATRRAYDPDEIHWTALRTWRSPRTGVTYPVEWKISVGERTIVLKPLMDDQENDARGSTGTLYWEGAVRAFDEQGQEVGRGYLELTGYGARLRF